MTVLRAGILGTGAVAQLHAEAIGARSDAQLVAVSDVDEARAAAFAQQFGGTAHPDLAAMLAAGLDVLHICTPPGVHADQAIAALDAGVNVILEKPPALTLAEFDRILEAEQRSSGRLAIVFQQRTGAAASTVKQLFDRGAFGRPLVATCHTLWHRGADYYDVPWRGTWQTEGGGPTLGLGIHQLDLLGYLLGEWSTVSGALWRLERDIETEDTSIATVTFASGTVASIVTTVLASRQTSHVRIDAEFATVEVEHLYGHAREHWRITPAPGVPAEQVAEWTLDAAADVPSGHDALLAELYPALLAGEPLPPIVGEPARSLELVTAIYASAREGRAVARADLADPALRGSLRSPVRGDP
jgi:predicted dehydrogenase